MSEQELVEQLKEAEKELAQAQSKLASAKKVWTEAETKLIDAKIHLERVKEALRALRARTPKYEPSPRDEAIEQFRKDFPELVEMAKQRDLDKGKE